MNVGKRFFWRINSQHAAGINTILAAGTLIAILVAIRIIWPISLLGFVFDPETQRIESIEPNSPADRSGLKSGDVILAMYDRPMTEVVRSNVFRFVEPPGSVAPIIVERDNQRISAALQIPWPSLQFQAIKVAFLILALTCWITGYAMGVVRRHNRQGSSLVALFWFGIATVCGCLPLALYAAEPIMLVIQWLIPSFFVPFSIYIHTIFPPRTTTSTVRRHPLIIFAVAWVPLLTFVGWTVGTNQTVLAVEAILKILVPLEVLCALGVVAWILHQSYRETLIAHTQRQIRVIAIASTSVALINILLFILPPLLFEQQIINTNWGIIVFIPISCEY
jgi:hypothetical protein